MTGRLVTWCSLAEHRLGEYHPVAGRLVELRFLGGLLETRSLEDLPRNSGTEITGETANTEKRRNRDEQSDAFLCSSSLRCSSGFTVLPVTSAIWLRQGPVVTFQFLKENV